MPNWNVKPRGTDFEIAENPFINPGKVKPAKRPQPFDKNFDPLTPSIPGVVQVYEVRIKNDTPEDNKRILQALDGVFSVQGIKPELWG